ncbi:MAG: hypothetical protein DME55_02850 [Verrucomicrobia bacterium]|nr:MAG: hypothetical protein DME55_02850 [Verrucomicrobiota bacterium]
MRSPFQSLPPGVGKGAKQAIAICNGYEYAVSIFYTLNTVRDGQLFQRIEKTFVVSQSIDIISVIRGTKSSIAVTPCFCVSLAAPG